MVLTGSDYDKIKTGDVAPNFSLLGTDGKTYSLKELEGKAYLVVFMCNHCPYVVPKVDELKRITADYKEKGLVVIAINPNEDEHYPDDSYENMQKVVKEWGINFLYLRDESQEVAKAYGAVCTPDPFLFDEEFKLIFHARIDDTHGDKPATKHELYEAIGEFFETGVITAKENPSMGCSIKWKY
jgi:peroxiredoxin